MSVSKVESAVRALSFATIHAARELPQSQDEFLRLCVTELRKLRTSDAEILDMMNVIAAWDRAEVERLIIKWTDEFGYALGGDAFSIVTQLRDWIATRK